MALPRSVPDAHFPERPNIASMRPAQMIRPTEVTALDGYRIRLRYSDGSEGEVDLSDLAGRGVFAEWNDPERFRVGRSGPTGAAAWSEEIELCPDALYMELTGKTVESVEQLMCPRKGPGAALRRGAFRRLGHRGSHAEVRGPRRPPSLTGRVARDS